MSSVATTPTISKFAYVDFHATPGVDMEVIASNAAYVTPDTAPHGIGGFLFSIVTDDAVELQSDITDHYTENNLSMQDHIALAPERITVSGLVGDIESNTSAYNDDAEKLAMEAEMKAVPDAVLPPDLPKPTPTRRGQSTTRINEQKRKTYNAFASSCIKAASDKVAAKQKRMWAAPEMATGATAWGWYNAKKKKDPSTSPQVYAFGFFQMAWRSRMLFTVETPWGTFDKMAIEKMSARQGGDTRFISEFSLTFKRIRTAKTIATRIVAIGRAANQTAPTTNAGQANTPTIDHPAEQTVATGKQAPATAPNGKQMESPSKPGESVQTTKVSPWAVAKGILGFPG